ncbi:MAG TPA: DoxX family protein [Candidatus Limnocylindria bacterium]|nr:DoxX family protein [Candidatus Limnocylindria bacterium]
MNPSLGLLILRIGGAGLLLYGHGWGKLMGFGERTASFSDPLGIGSPASLALVVFAEVVCALAVILGLFTRLAVIPPTVFFLVAVFVHHAADPWPKKELALIFAVPFLALFFTGAGAYSLDAVLARRRTVES